MLSKRRPETGPCSSNHAKNARFIPEIGWKVKLLEMAFPANWQSVDFDHAVIKQPFLQLCT